MIVEYQVTEKTLSNIRYLILGLFFAKIAILCV